MLELKVSRGDLLRRAVAALIEIDDEATVNYSPNGISLATLDKQEYLHAVLRIKSSVPITLDAHLQKYLHRERRIESFSFDNDLFCCDRCGVAGIDLDELYENLILDHDEEFSISIHADDGEEGFYFLLRRVGCNKFTRYVEMDLEAVNKLHVDAEIKLQYDYKVVIGIFSEELVRIFRYLGRDSGTANIIVTNGQVEFSTDAKKYVILNKEHNECIIGGVGEEDEVKFKINLHNLNAFRKASRFTEMMWILQTDDAPVTPNCPVGAIGHIFFYFT